MQVIKIEFTSMWFYKSITTIVLKLDQILRKSESSGPVILGSICQSLKIYADAHFLSDSGEVTDDSKEKDTKSDDDAKKESEADSDSDNEKELKKIRQQKTIKAMFYETFMKIIKDFEKNKFDNVNIILADFKDTLYVFYECLNDEKFNDQDSSETTIYNGIENLVGLCLPDHTVESA